MIGFTGTELFVGTCALTVFPIPSNDFSYFNLCPESGYMLKSYQLKQEWKKGKHTLHYQFSMSVQSGHILFSQRLLKITTIQLIIWVCSVMNSRSSQQRISISEGIENWVNRWRNGNRRGRKRNNNNMICNAHFR